MKNNIKTLNKIFLFTFTLFCLTEAGCSLGKIPVTGIKLDKTTLSLTQGETKKLTAKIEPANASNKTVIWISSNESVITVDKNGNVTARNTGHADVEAVSADGKKKAVCGVKVNSNNVNGAGFTMIKIPEVNNFELGDGLNADSQKRTADISAFMIGETEVTQELYYEVMKKNPSYFNNKPVYSEEERAVTEGEDQTRRPVDSILWYEAVIFCNEITKKVMGEEFCVYYSDKAMTQIYKEEDATETEQKTVYANWSKKGFRLPTEAEWEYAASGGGVTKKWAGTDDEEKIKDYAWFREEGNSKRRTHEVKLRAANAYGLYDMTGNVDEWCWDWYIKDTTPKGGSNPKGADSGKAKIIRGGNYIGDITTLMTITERWGWNPFNIKNRNALVGMRLAQSL